MCGGKPVRKFPFQTESKISNTFDIFATRAIMANTRKDDFSGGYVQNIVNVLMTVF